MQYTHHLPGFLLSKKEMSCFSTALKTVPCTEEWMLLIVMLYMRSHMNSSIALQHETGHIKRKVLQITEDVVMSPPPRYKLNTFKSSCVRLHYLARVISVITVMASVNKSGASSFMIQSATRPVYWGTAISPEVRHSPNHTLDLWTEKNCLTSCWINLKNQRSRDTTYP